MDRNSGRSSRAPKSSRAYLMRPFLPRQASELPETGETILPPSLNPTGPSPLKAATKSHMPPATCHMHTLLHHQHHTIPRGRRARTARQGLHCVRRCCCCTKSELAPGTRTWLNRVDRTRSQPYRPGGWSGAKIGEVGVDWERERSAEGW